MVEIHKPIGDLDRGIFESEESPKIVKGEFVKASRLSITEGACQGIHISTFQTPGMQRERVRDS
jgi:hypothetical protein